MNLHTLVHFKWTSGQQQNKMFVQDPWSWSLTVCIWTRKKTQYLCHDLITHAPAKLEPIYKKPFNSSNSFTYGRDFPPDLLRDFSKSILSFDFSFVKTSSSISEKLDISPGESAETEFSATFNCSQINRNSLSNHVQDIYHCLSVCVHAQRPAIRFRRF